MRFQGETRQEQAYWLRKNQDVAGIKPFNGCELIYCHYHYSSPIWHLSSTF